MRSLLRALGIVIGCAVVGTWGGAPVFAQGVTTAAMRGRVLDDAGTPVVGATVLLTNASTGQRFQVTSSPLNSWQLQMALRYTF